MLQLAAVNWDGMFSGGNYIFTCVFGMAIIISVAGVIGGTWQNIKKHEQDVRLKRDMVAKGYGVDEIERIIKTKPGRKA